MDMFHRQRLPLVGGFVIAALFLFTAAPAPAAAPSDPTPHAGAVSLFADGSLRSFFTGASARDRIVQMCVLCMAAALFILMKKFAPDTSNRSREPRRPRAPQDNEAPTQAAESTQKTAP